MFLCWCQRLYQIYRQRKIARLVRNGIVPKGVEQGEILEALKATKKPNALEMFGFLRMRVFRKSGLIEDLGVVSVKKVTTAFAAYVVDSLQDSTTYPLDDFKYHASGDDGTAEANSQTALENEVESRATGNQGENGASIYQSVGTINYTGGFTIQEHGILSANAAGTLLDRNLVPNAPVVISGDSIEFTYELTVNAES